MPATSRRNLRAFWIVLGAFVLLGGGMILTLRSLGTKDRFYAPSDAVRPWAEKNYKAAFDPSSVMPIPDLAASGPVPQWKVSSPIEDGKFKPELTGETAMVEVEATFTKDSARDSYYEIFNSDPSGGVSLPDGTRLRFSAVALFLPGDELDGKYYQGVPQWFDPRTGEPIVPPEGDPSWTEKLQFSPSEPILYLRVEKEGDAPFRWQWPSLFDARTQAPLSNSASWSSMEDVGIFRVDLRTWHQTSARALVRFAFGDPVEKEISLSSGSQVEIGTDASVKLLEVLPFGHGTSRSSSGGDQVSHGFDALTSPARGPRRTLIFSVWPPVNHRLLEIETEAMVKPRTLSGNGGISDLQFYGKDEVGGTTATLRRFPRMGRAVFDLAILPRLPEVENLFEVAIPQAEIQYPSELLGAVTGGAVVAQNVPFSRKRIPKSHFPIKFTDTTPAAILEEFEALSGAPLYFDRTTFTITSEPPQRFLGKLQEWWRTSKPRWIP